MVVVGYKDKRIRILHIIECNTRMACIDRIGPRCIDQHNTLFGNVTAVVQINAVDKAGFPFIGHKISVSVKVYLNILTKLIHRVIPACSSRL